MPHVTALYRYPVKGFTPELCDSLTVLDEGRIVGDRVLGFRFANSNVPDGTWSKKHEFVALVNTPGIARLHLRFDPIALRLCVSIEEAILLNETLDEVGRKKIAAAIESYVLKLDHNPLSNHPERLPLRLVGNGLSPRYQDDETGLITMHSRASLTAVSRAVGDKHLSEQRFRSNIAIDGLDAWEEQRWVGRKIRIGRIVFDVVKPKSRCLATQVNPNSGERDLPILKTLTHAFSQMKPTFAIAMLTCGTGGEIHVGDEVSLLN